MRTKILIDRKMANGSVKPFWVTDLTGEKFGMTTAIKIVGSNNGCVWLCRCDCGKETHVNGGALISGGTRSCGNHRIEAVVKANLIHGLSKTPEYRAWRSMYSRCYNPRNDSYEIYQKRGIRVCSGWIDSFETFLSDMGVRPNSGLSLDRIDNDLGYNCGHCDECTANKWALNCRWATSKVQTRNTSYNRFVEINGEKKCVKEWTEIYNTTPNTVYGRVRKGMDIVQAILTPKKQTTN